MPLNLSGNTITYTGITENAYFTDFEYGFFRKKVNRHGLMLYLDAGDANSYNGGGTTWYDLSGNGYNATMSNLTSSNWVLNGDIRCFETNETSDQGFRVSSFPLPTDRTYELWFNSKSYAIGWQTWFDDGGERVLFGTSTNTIFIYPDVDYSAGLVASTWYHIAYTMSGSEKTVQIFKNGIRTATGIYTSTLTSGTGTLYLLGDSGTEVTSGYCAIMRVYNRALHPYEIGENFIAQRERFGI